MSVPLFINSWIKFSYWLVYITLVLTVVILSTLFVMAVVSSPVAWCALIAAPILISLGYFFQNFFINKKMISAVPANNAKPEEWKVLSAPEVELLLSKDSERAPYVQSSAAERQKFLNKTEPLALPYLSRREVAEEIDRIIRAPQQISQGEYNICGPTAIIYALAFNRPEVLREFAFSFCENPANVGLSLPTRCYDEEVKLPVIMLILIALKHKCNVTGYHPIARSVEVFQGVSQPKQLMYWLTFFDNYLNIPLTNRTNIDALILRNTNKEPLSWLHRTLIGGVYSDVHQTFMSPTENFANLLKQFHEQKSSIILLLSINLCLKILGENNANEQLSLLGVEFSHYVYLNDLSYDNQADSVSITISTWGYCTKNVISLNEFIDGYCGFIAWDLSRKPEFKTTPDIHANNNSSYLTV